MQNARFDTTYSLESVTLPAAVEAVLLAVVIELDLSVRARRVAGGIIVLKIPLSTANDVVATVLEASYAGVREGGVLVTEVAAI